MGGTGPMMSIGLSQRWLQVRLHMRRVSQTAWLAIAIWLAVALGNFLGLPLIEQRSAALDLSIQQRRDAALVRSAGTSKAAGVVDRSDAGARQSAQLVPGLTAESSIARLQAWREQLGDLQQVHDSIGRILALASRYELKIDRADYEQTAQPAQGLLIYRMQLEIVAPYAVLRRYCDEVLRQFAFVALDELVLERESVATDALRAKLRFSLHLHRPNP
jgi:hypothetical protein